MENAVIDSDKFISIVQMHHALWDNSDADCADKIKKDNGWRAVMSSMYGNERLQSKKKKKRTRLVS
jgi:ribosomal protein L34